MSLILLKMEGCKDDLMGMDGDEGFFRLMAWVDVHGLKRGQRWQLERRWRKERRRAVPSPSSVFRYLGFFG